MTTVWRRLFRIIRSHYNTGTDHTGIGNPNDGPDINRGGAPFDHGNPQSGEGSSQRISDYPDQIIEDLANFKLTPPSSFAEVKKARNRESKKYHPDRFVNDPERQATAQKIMQIYNASYERLKAFFQSHPH